MEGPGADSEEKHEPVSDIDTAVVVVGLKALDPEWPIREAIGWKADMAQTSLILKMLHSPLGLTSGKPVRSIISWTVEASGG